MELKISSDSQCADYNFAVSGGLIGVYGTGMFIDEFSCLTTFVFEQKVALASAGLATVSIGYRTAGGAVFPTAIMAASPFNGPYAAFSTPLSNSVAVEIVFAIAVADLTAGRLIFMATYFNKDE